MPNPTKISAFYPDGFNLYSLVRRKSDGHILIPATLTFEALGTWNNARAGECDIPLTPYGADLYMVAFPNVPQSDYLISICLRAGDDPAIADPLLGGQDSSGGVMVTWSSVKTARG